MILGHIGARKGSKGVPGKNYRMIHGKPLIDWSLDQLFAHPMVDAVVVSTDDEDIYDHTIAKGALKIGLRPAHLATDTAGKWGVWQHALEASEALVGPVDAFLDLDCTSPLRLPEDITLALQLFAAKRPELLRSAQKPLFQPGGARPLWRAASVEIPAYRRGGPPAGADRL